MTSGCRHRSVLPSFAPLRRWLFLVAAVSVALAGGRAHAQGTAGVFPDPITVREVDRWGDALALDANARAAIGEAHERYRLLFAELRDGAIERHLRDHPQIGAIGGPGGDSRSLRNALRSRRGALDQIAALDAQLVSALSELARDDAAVERVRLAQERRRARGTLGMMTLIASDLELGDELETALRGRDDAERLRADSDPLVVAYEQRLTRLMTELADVSMRLPLATLEALEREGLADLGAVGFLGGMPDVDLGEIAADAARAAEIRRDVAAPQRRLRDAIASTHREFVRSLAATVPDEVHRDLRRTLVRRVYRGGVMGNDLESTFDDAMRRSDSEASRQAIGALRDEYRAARDPVIESLMDSVDAERRDGGQPGLPFEFVLRDGAPESEHRRTRRTLGERRDAIDADFGRRLATIAGDAEAAPGPRRRLVADGIEIDLGDLGIEFGDGGAVGAVVLGDGPGLGGSVTIAASTSPSAGAMRGAAGPAALESLRPLEDGAEHLWPVVEILHAEYADRYRAAESQERAIQREIGGGPRALGGMGGGPPDTAQIDRRHAHMRQTVERLMSIDALFFNDLVAALAGTEAEPLAHRLRAVRQREALATAAGGGGAGMMVLAMGSREADIELTTVVAGAGLDADALARIEPALRRWEESATAMQRQRFETVSAQQRIIERATAEMAQVDGEGRVQFMIDSDSPGFEAFSTAQERLVNASATVAQANRRARDEMVGLLSPDEARLFRRAYGRAAFPGVYRDAQDIAPKLARVRALDDLDDDRMADVVRLVDAHHDAYDELCDRMVEIEATTGAAFGLGGPPDMAAIQAIQTRQQTLARLRFERAELGAATLRSLASVLTDEQIARVGGLEPPAAPSRGAGAVFEFAR